MLCANNKGTFLFDEQDGQFTMMFYSNLAIKENTERGESEVSIALFGDANRALIGYASTVSILSIKPREINSKDDVKYALNQRCTIQ